MARLREPTAEDMQRFMQGGPSNRYQLPRGMAGRPPVLPPGFAELVLGGEEAPPAAPRREVERGELPPDTPLPDIEEPGEREERAAGAALSGELNPLVELVRGLLAERAQVVQPPAEPTVAATREAVNLETGAAVMSGRSVLLDLRELQAVRRAVGGAIARQLREELKALQPPRVRKKARPRRRVVREAPKGQAAVAAPPKGEGAEG